MTSVKAPLPSDPPPTTIRRKPILTYQSPTSQISALYLDKRPSPGTSPSSLSSASTALAPLAPKSTPRPWAPPSTNCSTSTLHRSAFSTNRVSSSSYKHPRMSTFLPLYHPFGPLALSLPDLDPTTFGLPVPHVTAGIGIGISGIFNDTEASTRQRSSNRARRPAVKLRDATDDTAGSGSGIAVTGASTSFVGTTPVPEPEPAVKDRASPRKRRNGGAGGGNKRRKRDADDGDATYPAKRVRNPRSSALASAPVASANTPSAEDADTSPPADEDGEKEKVRVTGRRSTRSRGQVVRRDSTASEATVTSVSVSLTATGPAARNMSAEMEVEDSAPTPALPPTNLKAAELDGTPAPTPVPPVTPSPAEGPLEETRGAQESS